MYWYIFQLFRESFWVVKSRFLCWLGLCNAHVSWFNSHLRLVISFHSWSISLAVPIFNHSLFVDILWEPSFFSIAYISHFFGEPSTPRPCKAHLLIPNVRSRTFQYPSHLHKSLLCWSTILIFPCWTLWLVVWNNLEHVFCFPIHGECHHANWRTHIFQRW